MAERRFGHNECQYWNASIDGRSAHEESHPAIGASHVATGTAGSWSFKAKA